MADKLQSNLHAYQEAAKAYIEDVKKGLRTSNVEEAGRLARLLIKLTPPQKKGQGTRAIKTGVHMAVRPLTQAGLTSDRMRTLVRRKDEEGLLAIFRHTGNRDIREIVPFREKWIERNNRGRVRRNIRKEGRATLETKEQNQYIRRKQANVGQAKGGWAAAHVKFAGKNPAAWIAAHRSSGTAEEKLVDGKKRSVIRLVNRSAWAGGAHARRQAATALQGRADAITRRMEMKEEREVRKRFQKIIRTATVR